MRQHTIPRRSFIPCAESLEKRALLSASFLGSPVLPRLSPTPALSVSTVPGNGDVNPYGVAFVPKGFASGGSIGSGSILVSNFNASSNLQGTGTTIESIGGIFGTTDFFQGGSGIGLTTALGVLKSGFVVVGNMPTTDGTSATAQSGSLLVLNKTGAQILELTDSIDGPWDLAINDSASSPQIFVANVLNGTIVRLTLKISHGTIGDITIAQIASGYTHRGDPSALELGPTGLVYDSKTKTLFVASTADGTIYAIPHANTAAVDTGVGKKRKKKREKSLEEEGGTKNR